MSEELQNKLGIAGFVLTTATSFAQLYELFFNIIKTLAATHTPYKAASLALLAAAAFIFFLMALGKLYFSSHKKVTPYVCLILPPLAILFLVFFHYINYCLTYISALLIIITLIFIAVRDMRR